MTWLRLWAFSFSLCDFISTSIHLVWKTLLPWRHPTLIICSILKYFTPFLCLFLYIIFVKSPYSNESILVSRLQQLNIPKKGNQILERIWIRTWNTCLKDMGEHSVCFSHSMHTLIDYIFPVLPLSYILFFYMNNFVTFYLWCVGNVGWLFLPLYPVYRAWIPRCK